jgi:hypothetical protein
LKGCGEGWMRDVPGGEKEKDDDEGEEEEKKKGKA